jgi:hypothetical protein
VIARVPGSASSGTLADLRAAFAEGGDVSLDLLVGLHRAAFVGPGWWRYAGPAITRLGGMPSWWGKRFWSTTRSDVLDGENVLERDGRMVPSHPMQAQVAASRFDGRPALVITYPRPAPWTWRQVTDELRPLADAPGTLVGLTVTSAPVLRAGLPFLLRREPGTAAAA